MANLLLVSLVFPCAWGVTVFFCFGSWLVILDQSGYWGFTLFTWSGSSVTALYGIAPHIALVFRHSFQGKGSCVLDWSRNLQHSCMWFYSLPRSIDSLLLVSSSNFWFLSLFILLSSHADLKKIFSLTHDWFFCFHFSTFRGLEFYLVSDVLLVSLFVVSLSYDTA